ncbi:MAG: hypothetical protein GXP49_10180 [Deltaproteobacteria bacterium]|nr:hypothetical protein [Deltaproteobacteria bacterium]
MADNKIFRVRHVLWIALALWPFSSSAHQEGLNLALFCRIKVSGIMGADTLGLVRSYEKDGPPAVRDQDLSTGWAVPEKGRQAIIFDFTNFTPMGFFPDRIELVWKQPPAHGCSISAGMDPRNLALLARAKGKDKMQIELAGPRVGYIEIATRNPGKDVHLLEAKVFGHGSGPPRPINISSKNLGDGSILLDWPKPDFSRVHHMELHRSRDSGFTPSAASLLLIPRTNHVVLKPPIACKPTGYELAVVAVGFDGKKIECGPRLVQRALPRLTPAFPIRGVVEGFYGRPWPRLHRLALLSAMAGMGFNFYAYAPKDDPRHRQDWTATLSLKEKERFAEILSTGSRLGIRVAYTISPGLTLDPDSKRDIELLKYKIDVMADIGYKNFGLLLDDIPKKPDETLGTAHARLVRYMKGVITDRAGPGSLFFFVPTVYSGTPSSLEQKEKDYLRALAKIPVDVPVAWTGPNVFSREIRVDDIAWLRKLIGGRRVIIWDNYPVNDVGKKGNLYLGAITGRDKNLFNIVSGFLVNPMIQAAASRIPLRAYSEYLFDPEEYEPQAVFNRAVQLELGGPERKCLAHLASFFTGSERVTTNSPDSSEISRLTSVFLRSLDEKRQQDASRQGFKLMEMFATAWRSGTCIYNSNLSTDMEDDLEPAAIIVSDVARLGAGLIAYLLNPDGDAKLKNIDNKLKAIENSSWHVGHEFLLRLVKQAHDSGARENSPRPKDKGGEPYLRVRLKLPAYSIAGRRLNIRMETDSNVDDCKLHFLGPPKAKPGRDRVVRWTPVRTGEFRMALVVKCGQLVDYAFRTIDILPGEVKASGRKDFIMPVLLAGAFILAALLISRIIVARRQK